MMKDKKYLLLEFFILFVALPLSFALDYPFWLKVIFVLIGFMYILFILKRIEGISFTVKKNIPWKHFWKRIMLQFGIIAVITTLFVQFTAPDQLFFVPRTNLKLYILIFLVYALLSVWPQEIIYRTFFMERYGLIFKTKSLLIFVNATVFSLAHLFFRNTLVTIITFIGGLLFALSYIKYKSTTLLSIEHALYGNWLFTVGMGEMLAFPGMEN